MSGTRCAMAAFGARVPRILARGPSGVRRDFLKAAAAVAVTGTALVHPQQRRWSAGCNDSAPSGVHEPPRPRRRRDGEPVEGQDFTVFRRLALSGPGGERPRGPAASTAGLDELLQAVGGCGEKEGPSVVLLGEVHDDVVAHRLQLQVLKRCAEVCRQQGRRLILSLEMFEGDSQRVLDEYVLERAIREQDLMQDARPWSNYPEDYRPLVEFCRAEGADGRPIRVIAANAPRRYVSLVARAGGAALEKLVAHDAAAREMLPSLPLPPPSEAYKQKFVETIASQMPPPPAAQGSRGEGECPFIGFSADAVREVRPEMMEAQLLWDHSMAKSIASALESGTPEESDPMVVHICGAFHCSHGLGIPEALPRYAGRFAEASSPPAEANSPGVWLPMDSAQDLPAGSPAAAAGVADSSQHVGPKPCPRGVVSIVCWPASVEMTDATVRGGRVPQSLGDMADWVVITEETYSD